MSRAISARAVLDNLLFKDGFPELFSLDGIRQVHSSKEHWDDPKHLAANPAWPLAKISTLDEPWPGSPRNIFLGHLQVFEIQLRGM